MAAQHERTSTPGRRGHAVRFAVFVLLAVVGSIGWSAAPATAQLLTTTTTEPEPTTTTSPTSTTSTSLFETSTTAVPTTTTSTATTTTVAPETTTSGPRPSTTTTAGPTSSTFVPPAGASSTTAPPADEVLDADLGKLPWFVGLSLFGFFVTIVILTVQWARTRRPR